MDVVSAPPAVSVCQEYWKHRHLCMLPLASGRSGGAGSLRDGGRLPAGWEQGPEVVAVGHAGEPVEDIGELGFGVVAIAPCSFDEGVEDGAAL